MATALMATSASTAVASSSSHQIQPGDTLTRIAEQYGVNIDDLIRMNNLSNPDLIYAGDDLLLAENEASGDLGDAVVGDTVYEIKPGDSLTLLAQQFNVMLSELLAVNEIDNVDQIFVGDILIIPTGERNGDPPATSDTEDVSGEVDVATDDDQDEAAPADDEPIDTEADQTSDLDDVAIGDTVYEIKPGDSLTLLAQQFDVMLSEILAVNEIENVDQIQAGDFLIIPTGERSDDSPTPSPPVEDEFDSDAGIDGAPEVESPDVDQEIDEAPGAESVDGDSSQSNDVSDQSHIVRLHLVARGETLSDIAARYEISIEQLTRANDLTAESTINVGSLLRIPDPSWEPVSSIEVDEEVPGTATMLENMPVHQQSLSLSSAPAALSIVTDYWEHQVSEWVFIENIPFHSNPHRGFRGNMDGETGGTIDYGVYAEPLSAVLANYGFIGDEFYTRGNPDELKSRIDRGQPVLVWMTDLVEPGERVEDLYQGERFALVPGQHVVVVYGYDEDNVYVADPGSGNYETYAWDVFTSSWASLDGMSMAVYPKG